jgi:pimeloyl-ACP methyl ester carboxylesterase
MSGVKRIRTVTLAAPTMSGTLQGIAFTLWLAPEPRGGVVVIHGADSRKENHHDFARTAIAGGLSAVCFDLRGHGDSAGPLDDRVIDDVAMMAFYLRTASAPERTARTFPVALRGSSLGGYLALAAARQARAAAVVAICPAPAELLRRGLAAHRFAFAADRTGLDSTLDAHDLDTAARELECPVLLLHAEGDETVPVEHSRELASCLRHPASRLIELPGGHHRSIQHDAELQAVSVRFLRRALLGGGAEQ